MSDIVERLRSSEPLPVCPYDKLSPHYLTAPDDKPCPFCGQENTSEGPDKCRGADTRIMGEAANEIERLREADKRIWRLCIEQRRFLKHQETISFSIVFTVCMSFRSAKSGR